MKYYIVLLLLLPGIMISRDNKFDYEFGGGFHYALFNYDASFSKLNEIPNCCPQFNNGDGSGFSGFLFYQTKLSNKIKGQLRFGFTKFDAEFKSIENTFVSDNGNVIPGEIEHLIQADFSGIFIQPIVSYELFNNINLHAGLDIDYLLSGDFFQVEQIVKPLDKGTFIDEDDNNTKLRRRNEIEDAIPNLISLQLGGLVGLSYDMKLSASGSYWLTPEVYYSFGFTDMADETPWKTNGLFLGLSLKYSH
ncbi:hypothetical protein ACFLSQ_00725 [Bacteroidota bacterium]